MHRKEDDVKKYSKKSALCELGERPVTDPPKEPRYPPLGLRLVASKTGSKQFRCLKTNEKTIPSPIFELESMIHEKEF